MALPVGMQEYNIAIDLQVSVSCVHNSHHNSFLTGEKWCFSQESYVLW